MKHLKVYLLFISDYKNSFSTVVIRCNNCGDEFIYKRPAEIFFQKHKCENCKITAEEYSKKIDNSNKTITANILIPEIIQDDMPNFSNKRNKIFNTNNSHEERDKEEVKNHKKTMWFQRKLDEKYGKEEFTVVTKYEKSNKPVKIRHNKCGTVIEIIPYSVLYKNPNNDTICFRCFTNEDLNRTDSDDKKVIYTSSEGLDIDDVISKIYQQEEEDKEMIRQKRPLQEVIENSKERNGDDSEIKPVLGKDIISFIENNSLLEGEVLISGDTYSKEVYNVKILGIDMYGNIIVR